ncbi:MAG: GatB/YqeY domain-containing protein [Solirubrobacterales bacterium]|nr:GatB/YqeY domain-containing protein [Solirubrobacterales bacterium]MCB0861057.1 GatB/YqeY domain-containing protein [Solirubrobacterales bacterium]
MSAVDQIRVDAQAALKDGDRKRASALRMIQDVLQQETKLGKGDEIGALQRERKKRMEAAEAFADAGRYEQAEDERFEAELITAYLPAQLSDDELAEMVREAIAETGATEPKQMGQVMGMLKEKVAGRADGKRVSTEVKSQLGA